MANQNETPEWPATVYQVGVTDPVLGGAEGPVNVMGLALAKRSLYQRLRNVTPWDAALAANFGYPAGACVRHGAVTWRAVVDNNVAPGSDAAKWERWGYSEAELNQLLAAIPSVLPYGVPPACPNSGPDGGANKSKIHKSALDEYWMWLGDAWRVVAGLYRQHLGATNYNLTPSGLTIATWTAHRAGEIRSNFFATISAINTAQWISARIFYVGSHSGDIGSDYTIAEVAGRPLIADANGLYPVEQGDSLSFILGSSHTVTASAKYYVMYAS
jgi:hypothetical protein